MKHLSFRQRCLLIGLAALLAAYFALLQVVAHSSLIQDVMSLYPSPDALLVAALFFILRFTCYLVVVPFLIALLVHSLASRLFQSR